ncbi:MAG: hypothetical protein ACK58L_19595 [Planctomycetota bacterium]
MPGDALGDMAAACEEVPDRKHHVTMTRDPKIMLPETAADIWSPQTAVLSLNNQHNRQT